MLFAKFKLYSSLYYQSYASLKKAAKLFAKLKIAKVIPIHKK